MSKVTGSRLCQTLGPTSDDSAILFAGLVPLGASIAATSAEGIAQTSRSTQEPLMSSILSTWDDKVDTSTTGAPRFAAVFCDETDLAGSQALFASLNPPFLIGPYTEQSLQAVIGSPATTYPIFSPLGDSASFESAAATNRWFCSANRSDLVKPFQSAIDVVASEVAKARGKSQVVVELVEDSAEPNEAQFANDVSNGLTFNGESTQDTTDGGVPAAVFSTFDLAAGSSGIALENAAESSLLPGGNQILTTLPDIVVLTGPTWAEPLIASVESRWFGKFKGGGLPPPVYLVLRRSPALSTFAIAGSHTSLAGRIFALDSDDTVGTGGNNLAENTSTLEGIYAASGINSPDPLGGDGYSACTLLAMYSVAAAATSAGVSAQALTSAQLSAGVQQVTSSNGMEANLVIDPDEIGTNLSLLANKDHLEFVGTSLFYGLNPGTGIPTLAAPTPDPTKAPNEGHSFSLECAQASTGQWSPVGVYYDKGSPGVPTSRTITCAN